MSDENEKTPLESGVPVPGEEAVLPDTDLEDVAGGGTFSDIYDALNESWTDIKKGFSDAWND